MTIRLVFTHASYEDDVVVFSNAEERMMMGMPSARFEMLDRPEHIDVEIHAVPR